MKKKVFRGLFTSRDEQGAGSAMSTSLLTGTLLAVIALMTNPQLGNAFHDSELDPAIKQHLAGIITQLEHACAMRNQPACIKKEQVRMAGNGLAMATRDCMAGNPMACQTVEAARAQVGFAMQPSAPEQAPPPSAPDPGAVIARPSVPDEGEYGVYHYDIYGAIAADIAAACPNCSARRLPTPADIAAVMDREYEDDPEAFYEQCLTWGWSGPRECQAIVSNREMFRNFTDRVNDDLDRIKQKGALCKQGDEDACVWLEELRARQEAINERLDLMNRALDGASRIHQGVRQQEQRVQDRNQGAHDRGMARGYYQWADQARQRGDRAAAERYQHQGDYHQRRALED